MAAIIKIALTSILTPVFLTLVFSVILISRQKADEKTSDMHFKVTVPKMVMTLGFALMLMSTLIMLCFTLFSEELPHWIFYLVLGLSILVGLYMVLKTLRFKVIVEGEKITVFSIIRRPYTFTFSEIVSAVRQVKKNQLKSERMVIKTASGKKLIVESAEISYERFKKRVGSEVEKQYLVGFE